MVTLVPKIDSKAVQLCCCVFRRAAHFTFTKFILIRTDVLVKCIFHF